METFTGHAGSFQVHKDVEAKFKNPDALAFKRAAPFLIITIVFMAVYSYSTTSQIKKDQLTSTRITHGEGYIKKMTPT